jgi:cytochrome c peroxidase
MPRCAGVAPGAVGQAFRAHGEGTRVAQLLGMNRRTRVRPSPLTFTFGAPALALLAAACSASGGIETTEGANGASVGMTQLDLSIKRLPNDLPFRDPTGFVTTVSSAGYVDLTNEFFQDLGTNGRRCVSCHEPSAGWTVTPPHLRALFDASRGGELPDALGLSAIFRTNDGSNSPSADVSTLSARRSAYSQLLTKGLIRVGLPVPAGADYFLAAVDDPYGHASAAELSLFRRPAPTTNLKFLSTIMWDGRETLAGTDHCNGAHEGGKCFAPMAADFADQSNVATLGHAQGAAALTDAQRASIVAFEMTLTTAQVIDDEVGRLDRAGARGGIDGILAQTTYYGLNDNLGDYRTGAPFTPNVFDVYAAWASSEEDERQAVARGEALFNTRPITITGVAGLNGAVGSPFNPPLPDTFVGACTTCHDSPNAGNHSIVAPLNIGLTDAVRRTPDMPLYTICKVADPGTCIQTTDPGRALVSGKYADVGKFKGPILRGLAARAPYFHNGFAKDFDAVIDFYNERFGMNVTEREHRDLVAFLRTL